VKEVISILQIYEREYKKYEPYSEEQNKYHNLLRDLYNNTFVLYSTEKGTFKSKYKKFEKCPPDSKEWQEYYKRLEDLHDNLVCRGQLRDVEMTALLIALNKAGYGFHRENKKGELTIPLGKPSGKPGGKGWKNRNICDSKNLENVSNALRHFRPIILDGDHTDTIESAQKGDFVYLDPPYDPKSYTSTFTAYTKNGFGREDQVQLASIFSKLSERGCFVLLSNSDTPFIRELYSGHGFTVREVQDVKRAINCKASKRMGHKELLISNNTGLNGGTQK
jgi:DNA adenine methylase